MFKKCLLFKKSDVKQALRKNRNSAQKMPHLYKKLNPVVAAFLLEWLGRSALARFGQHLAHSSDALVRLWIRSQNMQLRLNLNNNNIFQVLCTL